MSENIGKIAADFVASLGPELVKGTGKAIGRSKDKIANNLNLGVIKYLDEIYEKCSKTKTLLYTDKAVDLSEIYVNGHIQQHGTTLTDTELARQIAKNNLSAVISGNAGSGKSMMMKYLTLQLIRDQNRKIPVFFELRNINKEKDLPLIEHLWHHIDATVTDLSKDRFDHALAKGKFVFILDGFDELDNDISNEIELQFRQLYKKFDSNSFIISSRPDVKLNSSVDLDVFHVQKMSVKQVSELISKLNYDPEQKTAFITDIHKFLYKEHEDFLSSPLLATMMLLTYHQFASIPEKVHIFYGQVYEVLFSRHDVRKDGNYSRKFETKLAMDDFSTVFQAFSAISYIAKDFQFSERLALSTCQEAITFSGFEVKKKEFLTDLMKSVCLLIRDGNRIVFTHRSFQEYFTALFISNLSDELFKEVISKIENRLEFDNVLYLLFGMQQERIERLFILPKINKLLETTGGKNFSEIANNFITHFYPVIVFHPLEDNIMHHNHAITMGVSETGIGEIGFSLSPDFKYIPYLSRCYPSEFKKCLDYAKRKYGDPQFALTSQMLTQELIPNAEERTYTKEELIPFLQKRYDIVDEITKLVEAMKSVKSRINSRETTQNSSLKDILKKTK